MLNIILDFQQVMTYAVSSRHEDEGSKRNQSWDVDGISGGKHMISGKLKITSTAKMELINITAELNKIVRSQSISSGILSLFNPHTTAGLTINEGADPDVCRDIISGLEHIVPRNLNYRHAEGNSPSHLMALLTGSSLTIHIDNGSLQLGTWQKVFFCEYDGPRSRSINWKIISDKI
jgi:secondary thiamine-phosphate synthase enzyme